MAIAIGIGLHNFSEGLAIGQGLAGLIGGGPTFLSTLVGTMFDSVFVFVGCLALAAGAILYVLGELLPVGRRL